MSRRESDKLLATRMRYEALRGELRSSMNSVGHAWHYGREEFLGEPMSLDFRRLGAAEIARFRPLVQIAVDASGALNKALGALKAAHRMPSAAALSRHAANRSRQGGGA